jgi:hypothetical protein
MGTCDLQHARRVHVVHREVPGAQVDDLLEVRAVGDGPGSWHWSGLKLNRGSVTEGRMPTLVVVDLLDERPMNGSAMAMSR